MNKFELWVFRKLVRKQVARANEYPGQVTQMYQIIRNETEIRFVEDNAPTVRAFLKECFNYATPGK